MPKDFYTLLILPKKHSSAKKISLSSTLVTGASIFIMGLILFVMYFSYDYIHIRREQAELNRLKQKTAEQKQQIEGLVDKVEQFSQKMEELKQFDKKLRIMANLEKGRAKEQVLGIGGPSGEESRIRSQISADDKVLVEGAHRQVGKLMDEAIAREASFSALLTLLKEKKSLVAATPSIWPVVGWVTSEFGKRESPFGNGGEVHRGMDISTKHGRPIQAPAEGVVTEVAYHQDVGQMIQIDHGHGVATYYAHLSKAIVRAGAVVKRGDKIGYVGNTGRSTGPHLHYGVLLNGIFVNPRKYLN